MRQQVASCGICDQPIYAEVELGVPASAARAILQRAASEHLHTHPEPVVAHFYLQTTIERLPPDERLLLIREIYTDLRRLWGDADGRGVYTIDEALGSAAMYRLWHSASACSHPGCAHRSPLPAVPPAAAFIAGRAR